MLGSPLIGQPVPLLNQQSGFSGTERASGRLADSPELSIENLDKEDEADRPDIPEGLAPEEGTNGPKVSDDVKSVPMRSNASPARVVAGERHTHGKRKRGRPKGAKDKTERVRRT